MLEELLHVGSTKEGKDLQKINPKHQENGNRIIHYLKCKWIKCTKRYRPAGWMKTPA